MKKVYIIIAAILCLSLFTGCGATPAAAPAISTEAAQTQAPETSELMAYESYAGNWTLVGKGNEVLNRIQTLIPFHAATELTLDEISGSHVKGTLVSTSAAINAADYQAAYIDFDGNIAGGIMSISYEDDACGSAGAIELVFGDSEITATITRDIPVSETEWGLPEGTFTFLKQIDTEEIETSLDETGAFEQLFSLVTDDITAPFSENELADDQIVEILARNIGMGSIDLGEFGDLALTEAGISVDESVIDNLSERYFGISISKHHSVNNAEYNEGVYTIPEASIETEFPAISAVLQSIGEDGTYYALVNYVIDFGENGYVYEYQYLIKLQKSDDGYTIKSIEKVDEPLEYGSIVSNDESSSEDTSFMETESLGGLKIGLSADEVVALLGDPITGDWKENEADGEEHQSWSYDGIELDMLRDADSNILVNAIKITTPCELRTSRGIGIGGSYDAVLDAYDAKIDPSNIPADHSMLVAGSLYDGIVFSFERAEVVEIFIGAASE